MNMARMEDYCVPLHFLLVENFLTHILEVKVLPQLTEKQLFCHNLELALSFCYFCCNLETLE